MFDIYDWLHEQEIGTYKFVDISGLSPAENRSLPTAILLVYPLPKDYILKFASGEIDYSGYSRAEELIDGMADALAEKIREAGYQAISQSENGLDSRGDFVEETKSSPLPHKKIAVMSGLGWIGKNNLLVTEEYGCAFVMSSVLTDFPITSEPTPIVLPKCGSCQLCKNICPAAVLHGTTWQPGMDRAKIVDVYHCEVCMMCMAKCKYSLKYAKGKS